MQSFNLRALDQWVDWPMMTPLLFDVEEADYRVCRVQIVADAPIRVYAVTEDDYQPVAVAAGLFEIEFTALTDTALAWFGDLRANPGDKVKGEPLVRIVQLARSQMMTGEDESSFTVIEPRGSVESMEMRRLQRLMMINVERRVQMQIDAMRDMQERDKQGEKQDEPVVQTAQ